MDARSVWRQLSWDARASAFAIGLALLLAFPGRVTAANVIKIGGSGAALGTIQMLADAFTKLDPEFRATTVPSLGSSGSIKALVVGAIDLAVTSRPMKDDERKLDVKETEYGRTPFVFAVSTTSKVTAITRRQVADIYAGKLKNWPDRTPIRVVLRPDSDVDTDIVKSMSPEIKQALSVAEQRPGVAFSVSDQDAANDIEKITGAIGASTLALIISEKHALRPLKLDGVEPTPKNIASGAYPYYKQVFVVTSARRSATTQRFIAFIQSPAGRKILARTGHWIP